MQRHAAPWLAASRSIFGSIARPEEDLSPLIDLQYNGGGSSAPPKRRLEDASDFFKSLTAIDLMLRRLPPLLATLAIVLAIITGCSKAPTHIVSPGLDLDPSIAISVAPLERMDDPQLRHLVDAAAIWREQRGPLRVVVDQVVLVDDVPDFLAALQTWTNDAYFPILVDDPAWTPAFVRAFRPARIVRFSSPTAHRPSGPLEEWRTAEVAVGRSWMKAERGEEAPPPAGSPPRGLGPTPPGVVLSHPGSYSLAGAATLAAGRFQPLLRVERLEAVRADGRPKLLGFDDVPDAAQALEFAGKVESRVASTTSEYRRLGDRVDFLTLAGDWPYRYRAAGGLSIAADDRALDDLVGRIMPSGSVDIDSLRLRWAYAGRLLGDPPGSVYRAMASLFLQPRSALLWNTYSGGPPWSSYDVTGATAIFKLVRPDAGAVLARSGVAADLASWHQATSAADARDLFLLNSSGAPGEFSITGGPGISADVPFGPPSVVSMIHSFSAAAPDDPTTIAGRFLERGAFAYYGSMNEPYLSAFRAPYLATQLISVETPLAAALRQGPYEAFGQPWRLAYLGDPLYRIEPISTKIPRDRRPPADDVEGALPIILRDRPDIRDPEGTLDWCYDAVLLSLTSQAGEVKNAVGRSGELLDALSYIDRERLPPPRRTKFDDLLIDQSIAIGDVGGLLQRLFRIQAGSRTPKVWRTIETLALERLAELLRGRDWPGALDLWHPVAIGPWPPESDFPARFTRRIALAAEAEGAQRLEAFRRRLAEACSGFEGSQIPAARRSALLEELKPIEKSKPTP